MKHTWTLFQRDCTPRIRLASALYSLASAHSQTWKKLKVVTGVSFQMIFIMTKQKGQCSSTSWCASTSCEHRRDASELFFQISTALVQVCDLCFQISNSLFEELGLVILSVHDFLQMLRIGWHIVVIYSAVEAPSPVPHRAFVVPRLRAAYISE